MKLVKNNKNKKGFTLIELIVVIAIIAILALILIPTISGYIGRAEEARDKANARNLYTAAVLVLETGTDEEVADITNSVTEYGDFGDDYTVTVTGDKVVVTYNKITYDGSEFTTPTE